MYAHYSSLLLVPSWYFSNLDMSGRRVDIDQRPELRYGSVEFAVPADYNSSRTPAPLNYVFAIDVSAQAVKSGMVQAACNAIRHALYGSSTSKLAAGNKIGLLTFDRSVHFYNLAVSLFSLHDGRLLLIMRFHNRLVYHKPRCWSWPISMKCLYPWNTDSSWIPLNLSKYLE